MNLIRNLLGLIITFTLLPITISALDYICNINFDYLQVNDEVSLMQLRQTLLISYDLNINYDSIDFIYKNKECRLSMVNNKLLLQPGSQIYLADIDDLYFECANGCIYVKYYRGDKEYESVIASEKGFYIDQFLDCDVDDELSDISQE